MAECNVIAHRGANIIAPQNTIEAFKMSKESVVTVSKQIFI